MITPKTVHIIGGAQHGTSVTIKAGTSLMFQDGSFGVIQEAVVNGVTFHIAVHAQAAPAQTHETLANLRHLMRDVRPFTDGRVLNTHPGLPAYDMIGRLAD